MREIEYRAWDNEKKKYKYPKLWDNTMPSNWEKHYILEQYTGLKDKNRVKVFEGDIIKTYNGDIFEVKWNSEWSGFNLIFDARPIKAFPYESNELEVIGNIHQDKHLLQ